MQAKRPLTGVTPASAKSSKDILQENAPRPTGEEQPNRFARRSPKFTVCVIMLVYIASYNKRTRRNVEKCVSSASYATDYSVRVIPAVEFAVRFASNLSIQNRFKVSNNHFP